MTYPSAVMHVLVTMALLCSLSLAPVLPPWEPDPSAIQIRSGWRKKSPLARRSGFLGW